MPVAALGDVRAGALGKGLYLRQQVKFCYLLRVDFDAHFQAVDLLDIKHGAGFNHRDFFDLAVLGFLLYVLKKSPWCRSRLCDPVRPAPGLPAS